MNVLINLTGRLSLYDNEFTGGIPPEIYNLATLKNFFLGDNIGITGEISPDIVKMTALERLVVPRTGMGGVLPDEFFATNNMKTFIAAEAKFSGNLEPDQWVKLTGLQNLDLSFNQFGGPIPNVFHALGQLRK